MSLETKDYQAIFSYLRSLHFHFLDDWVIQCVNYCKSASPNLSLEALKEFVKEQWLLVNLRSMKVPSLPPDLASCHKKILNGKFTVQVESMLDCSKSSYSQWQKMQKINMENIEATKEFNEQSEKEVNRCLVFEISDGVQELRAMEYKPIRKILTNDPELLPGFKMLIIGPVECRKGMILLKEENVKVYGGEVDTLTDTHNLRSVLMRRLDLNEEDLPDRRFSNNKVESESFNDNNLENEPLQKTNNSEKIDSENVEKLLSQNNDLFLSLPFENEIFGCETYQSSTINSELSEFNCNSDVKTVNENNFRTSQNSENLRRDGNMFDDVYRTMYRKHSLPPEDKTTPSPKKVYCNSKVDNDLLSKKIFTTQNSVANSKSNFIDFIDEDWEESLNNQNLQKPKEPVKIKSGCFQSSSNAMLSSLSNYVQKNSAVRENLNLVKNISPRPFVYLKHITSIKLDNPRVFTIKAIILTLKKKITVENELYNLRGIITDGSLTIEADFSSSIVENFLEYSPCEMQAMIKDKHLNTAIHSRITEAFVKAQEKFISLNCLMKIKFFPNGEIPPLVLSLEEVNSQHLSALKLRTE